jgi:tetratricopeptide (TPR) repeat protein
VRNPSIPLRPLAAALLAASTFGCAAVRAPLTCPESGGARWTEVTSAHFVLHTDAEPAEARAFVAQFEGLYGALALVTHRPATAAARIEVVHFERRKDFYEIAGRDPTMKAYFTPEAPGDLEPQPTMVLYGEDLPQDARETFLHELSHRFLDARFASLPVWLNEGLAQYYATLEATPDRVVLGAPGGLDVSDRPLMWSSWRGSAETLQLPSGKAPRVRDLIDGDRASFYVMRPGVARAALSNADRERKSVNYATAWKLVRYLMDGPDAGDRARFTSFLAALEHGEPARASFLAAFGRDLPRVEEAFRRYLTQDSATRRVVQHPLEPGATDATARPMSDAEVHLLWARLLPHTPAFTDLIRRQLDEALARESSSPEVRYRRAIFFMRVEQIDEASRELAAALATRPDDPRYLLASALWHYRRAELAKQDEVHIPPELLEHLARTASTASQMNLAVLQLAASGRTEEGSRLLDRALAADPLCWQCQKTRAILLSERGETDAALAAMDRVIALVPEGMSIDNLVALRRWIAGRGGSAVGVPPPR